MESTEPISARRFCSLNLWPPMDPSPIVIQPTLQLQPKGDEGAVCKENQSRYDKSFIMISPEMKTPQDLKNKGLKATLPRLKILNLFETSDERHLTAEDVYKLLLNDGMEIGLATIYRVLTQFEQAGLLIRHHFESGKAVFELDQGDHHDHLVCIQCGNVEEFYDSEIERRQAKIAKERGFQIQDHSLHLYADCIRTDCENKKKVKS
jgi:Fur family ferric uptake transcriptional regulator